MSGQFAYLLDNDALQIVDVSDPPRPRRVGRLAIRGWVVGLAVWSHYACLAQGTIALQIIDVSDPANPRRVGQFDSTSGANDVGGLGHYAFVADGLSGLQVVDLQDPASPQRVGAYKSNGGYARAVAVSSNYVYLADTASGLQVIDVTNPGTPRPAGRSEAVLSVNDALKRRKKSDQTKAEIAQRLRRETTVSWESWARATIRLIREKNVRATGEKLERPPKGPNSGT